MSTAGVGEGTLAIEQGLIGAILGKPELLVELPWLATEHFAHFATKATWETIRNLEAKANQIDVSSAVAELERTGRVEAVGDYAALTTWVLDAPKSEVFVQDYARQIREHALHRRVLEIADGAVADGRAGAIFGRDLLGELLKHLSGVDADDVHDDARGIGDLAKEHVRTLEAEAARCVNGKVALTGVPTGIAGLDAEIGGWQFGIMSVIAARPAMGKSSVGLATADAASAAGFGVHVFSMEDPRRMYMNRAYARISQIPISRIANGSFTRDDIRSFVHAQRELARRQERWLVDDRSGITAEDIVRSVRRHRRANNTRVVIVDYLQLIKRSRGSYAKSRHEQITETLHELADAAKNDQMAYVVMSQLNRDLEKRDDKRPTESDLRESGTIEERAKTIVALYRGRKYYAQPHKDIDTDEDGEVLSQERFEKTLQLLVIKNNQGPSPVRVLANWHGETTRVM